MSLLERRRWFDEISQSIQHHLVTVLLGPRQCGKTTLARQVAERRKGHWFDLEVASQRAALDNPELALSELEGLVVLDEAQRQPALPATSTCSPAPSWCGSCGPGSRTSASGR